MVTLPNKEVTISQVNGNCQWCSSSLDHSRGAIMSNVNKEEAVKETGHVSDNDLVGVILPIHIVHINYKMNVQKTINVVV